MATIADKLTYLNETKTAIKNALVSKGVDVRDTDTFRSYADKIENISGEPATRFGASLDTFFGEVDENGVLNKPTAPTALNFAGVTEIGEDVLQRAFYCNTSITSVDLSSLTTVGGCGLYYAFYGCTSITSVDLSSLQTVDIWGLRNAFEGCRITSLDLNSLESIGQGGMTNAFGACKSITSVDLSSLTTVDSQGMESAFCLCTGITSVDLSSLQSVGAEGLNKAFYDCYRLATISFPSLTEVSTHSFSSNTDNDTNNLAFSGCTNLTEIHFRADMQATIEGLDGYTNKFGATNATIYFDLQ